MMVLNSISIHMRIKEGFILREIGTDHVIVPEGLEVINFNKLASLNKSAKYLWEHLEEKDFCAEDMAKLLTEKYRVTQERALADAKALVDRWKEIGLITE